MTVEEKDTQDNTTKYVLSESDLHQLIREKFERAEMQRLAENKIRERLLQEQD